MIVLVLSLCYLVVKCVNKLEQEACSDERSLIWTGYTLLEILSVFSGSQGGIWRWYLMLASRTPALGGANPAARPAAHNLGSYRGIGEIVPLVNCIFQWGVVIGAFLSVLSIVPCSCARLTYFFHPKSRQINAVLITLKLITLTLRRTPLAYI